MPTSGPFLFSMTSRSQIGFTSKPPVRPVAHIFVNHEPTVSLGQVIAIGLFLAPSYVGMEVLTFSDNFRLAVDHM